MSSVTDFSYVFILYGHRFGDLYETKLFSDTVLVSNNGKTFLVHKLILAMNSEYFKTLLFVNKYQSPNNTYYLDFNDIVIDQYLQLIYNRKVRIKTNWQDVIALYKLLSFTLTEVPNQAQYLNEMIVPPKEYEQFITSVITVYNGEVPLEFIERIPPNNLQYLNLNHFDKEFTEALIKSVENDNEKYRIAVQAVKDGLHPSIYHLVQYENLNPQDIIPASNPYLRHIFNGNHLLTDDIYDTISKGQPFTAVIYGIHSIDLRYEENVYKIRGRTSDKQAIMKNDILQGDEIPIEKLKVGTIIKIISYTRFHDGNDFYVKPEDKYAISLDKFEMVDY